MKKVMSLTALVATIIFVASACNKVATQSTNLKFERVELGGCNNQFDASEVRDADTAQGDTVIFNFDNGKLKVAIGVNHTCCASMEATFSIVNGRIILNVADTTANQEQYCRCECYYTFDYYFSDLENAEYLFEVHFTSPDKQWTKYFQNTATVR